MTSLARIRCAAQLQKPDAVPVAPYLGNQDLNWSAKKAEGRGSRLFAKVATLPEKSVRAFFAYYPFVDLA